MNLDEEKKRKVAGWVAQGLKVFEIQKRLESELGVRMTYMEVRMLLGDLSLVPKDQPAPVGEKQLSGPAPIASPGPGPRPSEPPPVPASPPQTADQTPASATGKVSVNVDVVTQPGTLASGTVTFSDGKSASWYLDQMGRLGLAPKQQGYRPSPEDIEDFQFELQNELQKLGF